MRGLRRFPDRHARGQARGFTLAEVLIAILFVSIALFGYVSLHARLLQSGMKMEVRQQKREAVSSEMCGVLYSMESSPSTFAYDVDKTGVSGYEAGSKKLYRVRVWNNWTDNQGPQQIVVETIKGREDAGW